MSDTIWGDPSFLHVQSPVRSTDLKALAPRCDRLQFCDALSEADHLVVATFLRANPRLTLRVFGGFADPSLFKYYEGIRRLQIDGYTGPYPAMLQLLPRSLSALTIVAPLTPALDLGALEKLEEITDLHVFARTKNSAVLKTLPQLRRLSLGKVSARDLGVIEQLRSLEELCLFGAVVPVNTLPSSLENLRKINLINLSKTERVDNLSSFGQLQSIKLERMPRVTGLPSLAPLVHLNRVWLENLRNLHDLQPVADAPQLEWLACMSMPQLEPSHFKPFADHPAFRQVYYSSGPFSAALFGRGGHKTQDVIREQLGLDPEIHAAWPRS